MGIDRRSWDRGSTHGRGALSCLLEGMVAQGLVTGSRSQTSLGTIQMINHEPCKHTWGIPEPAIHPGSEGIPSN